jgi:hypothetical protein
LHHERCFFLCFVSPWGHVKKNEWLKKRMDVIKLLFII